MADVRDSQLEPVIVRHEAVRAEPVDAADGLRKAVLLDESDGTPTFAIRRFEIDPDSTVPRHTNAIEHEQYVLDGEYVVGIDDIEYTVSAGDTVHIPAQTVHWYRNEGDEQVAFLCAVPAGDDTIQLVE